MSVQIFDGSHPPAKGPGAPTGNELRVLTPQYPLANVTRDATIPKVTLPTDGIVATLAGGDKLFIQNLDTDPLKIKKGSGASNTSFDYVLAGGDVDDDGKGGVIEITDYVGVITIFAASYRFVWHHSAA